MREINKSPISLRGFPLARREGRKEREERKWRHQASHLKGSHHVAIDKFAFIAPSTRVCTLEWYERERGGGEKRDAAQASCCVSGSRSQESKSRATSSSSTPPPLPSFIVSVETLRSHETTTERASSWTRRHAASRTAYTKQLATSFLDIRRLRKPLNPRPFHYEKNCYLYASVLSNFIRELRPEYDTR